MKFILPFLLLNSFVHALELREIDLIPMESHYEAVLDMDKPMYRLGEVLMLRNNPEQFVIPFNYRFQGQIWIYECRRAHFLTATKPSKARFVGF